MIKFTYMFVCLIIIVKYSEEGTFRPIVVGWFLDLTVK